MMARAAFFVVILMVVSVSCLWGAPAGMRLGDTEIADRAGLTAEQKQELADLFETTQKEIIKSRAELDIKRLEIGKLVRSEDADMREIRKLVGESEQARSSALLARLERRVRMKQILTPEQMRKFRRVGRERVGRHPSEGLGPRWEHRGRPGEKSGRYGMPQRGMPGRDQRPVRRGHPDREGGHGPCR